MYNLVLNLITNLKYIYDYRNNTKQCYLANKYMMENQNKNLTISLYPIYNYNNNNFKY